MRPTTFLALCTLALFACVASASAQNAPATPEQIREWNSHLRHVRALPEDSLLSLVRLPQTCYVVPHTHWDKEWGWTKERHTFRLVKLIDNTISILENDPDYRLFVLDGQSSLISDYLSLRPEMADRVRALAQANRLQLGPWYTQGDMLVASGEEIVRNLQIGIRTAQEAGGVMMHGHTADNFGFCAQLPQIYRQFGISTASLYRGPDDNAPHNRAVFRWNALDGTPVDVVNLLGPAGYLLFTWPFDVPGMAEAFFLRALPYLQEGAISDRLLLSAGSDAVEPNADLPRVLGRLGQEFPSKTFRIASYADYAADVLAENPGLPEYSGILRMGGGCVGSITARMDLKRANAESYTVIEQFGEPLSAFAWLIAGRRYPGTAFNRAWEMLFENLTHDNMAGYSPREVNLISHGRYIEATRIGETAAISGMKVLVERIRTPDKTDILRKPLVVFNTLPWQRTDMVETIHTTEPRDRAVDAFTQGDYHSYVVTDLEGNRVPATVTRELGPNFRVRFLAERVPAMGYKTYLLVAVHEAPERNLPPAETRVIENELLRLTFDEDGTFDMLDKETGAVYPGLHYLTSTRNPHSRPLYFSLAGESQSTVGHRAELRVVESGPAGQTMRIRWTDWRVPQRGSDAGVIVPAMSYVTVNAGLKRVDVYTEIDNTAESHLVRAMFPVPVRADSITIGVQFGSMRAPVYGRGPHRPSGQWSHEFYPNQDWTDVSNGRTGLAVFNRGTPAVAAYPTADDRGTILALPLLRGSGGGSADARPSIPGNRFAERPAPDGQMLGLQTMSYSIMPHRGNWQSAGIARHGASAAARLWPETLTINDPAKWQVGPYGLPQSFEWPEGDLPPELSFLSVEPEGVHMSALKKAESGDALIVRLYNTTPESKETTLRFFQRARDVRAVNMLEAPAEGLPEVRWNADDNGTTARLTLRPFGIVTLRLEVEPAPERLWPQTAY